MKTTWNVSSVSHSFDAYDDYVEEALGYKPLIADLARTHGSAIEVIDYGCGGGKVSRRLTRAGIERVTGVDISATMIEKASAAGTVQGALRYRLIESGKLPFSDATFDAAVCCFVFINVHSRDELQRIADEIFRTLKPAGTLYLLDSHPAATGIRYSTFQSGDAGVSYRDGDTRSVYLDVPGQEVFKIVDTHWEFGTYEAVLRGAGAACVERFERSSADIPREDRARLGENEARQAPFVLFKASKASAGGRS